MLKWLHTASPREPQTSFKQDSHTPAMRQPFPRPHQLWGSWADPICSPGPGGGRAPCLWLLLLLSLLFLNVTRMHQVGTGVSTMAETGPHPYD